MKKNCLALALLFVLLPLIACGGPSERLTPTPGIKPETVTPFPTATEELPQIAKVGERQESGGLALTVVNVSRPEQIDDFWTPDEGEMFLVIEVIIENVTREKAPYNPLYFKIKDAEGFEYTSSFIAPDPDLKSGELAKGERVRGNVAFEVKVDAKGFVVVYEPLVLFGGYKALRVELGF